LKSKRQHDTKWLPTHKSAHFISSMTLQICCVALEINGHYTI